MKKIITAIIVTSMVLALCSCTAEQAAQTAVDTLNSVSTSDSEEVLGVKNGYFSEYSTEVTIGDALDNFLSTPMWQYFETEDGEMIVQCTGGCTYQEQNVVAKVQFELYDDDTFDLYTLALNDISQDMLMTAAFFEKAYEEAGVSDTNTVTQTISDSVDEEDISGYLNLTSYSGDWSDGNVMGMSIEPETISVGDSTPFTIYRTRGKDVEYSINHIKSVEGNTVKVEGSYGFENYVPCLYTIEFLSDVINLTISEEKGESMYTFYKE